MTYAGAASRLAPADGLALPWRKWAWQPKIDGCYAVGTTDEAGRLVSLVSRAGRPLGEAADLMGIHCGPPLATLVGELDAHTEAGNRLAALRGWRNLHLFDCLRVGGLDISHAPYAARWGELHRAHTDLEMAGLARVVPMREDDRRWRWTQRDADVRIRGPVTDLRRMTLPPPRRRVSPPGTMISGGPPRDLRRFPVVPLMRGPTAAADLWRSYVECGGGEGLVAVRLDAPAGGRNAKRKIKASDTLDCRVVSVGNGASILEYGGHRFAVSSRGRLRLEAGQVVEVACDGWYEHAVIPRFARVLRIREDLPDAPC